MFADGVGRAVDEPTHRQRSRTQRLATTLAFATLFFAGAAFSAGAGDMLVQAVESDCGTLQEMTSTEDECRDAETAAEEQSPADETTSGATDEPTSHAGADRAGSEEPPETEPARADDQDDQSEPSVEPGGSKSDEASGGTPDEASGGTPDEASGGTSDEASGGTSDEPAAADDAGAARNGSSGGSAAGPARTRRNVDGRVGGSHGKAKKRHAKKEHAKLAGPPIIARATRADYRRRLDPEASNFGGAATVWLHRTVPDPTLPASRLAPDFARRLAAEARRAGVDWALVLAQLRAERRYGRRPADRAGLRVRSERLGALVEAAGEWRAFLAVSGRTLFADRAMALTRFHRAVGLAALVTGLDAAKEPLAERTLTDKRIAIYGGGRRDIAAGRVDVRVIVLVRYMAESFGQVTVSSLVTGHRLYARPGVVSAHVYGQAVDIAALNGKPILGNSEPGGLTERAVRDILLLPNGLRPQQLISLLGLGGPSFPMADHADHIHAGY